MTSTPAAGPVCPGIAPSPHHCLGSGPDSRLPAPRQAHVHTSIPGALPDGGTAGVHTCGAGLTCVAGVEGRGVGVGAAGHPGHSAHAADLPNAADQQHQGGTCHMCWPQW